MSMHIILNKCVPSDTEYRSLPSIPVKITERLTSGSCPQITAPPFEKNNTLYFRSKASIFIEGDILLTSGRTPHPTPHPSEPYRIVPPLPLPCPPGRWAGRSMAFIYPGRLALRGAVKRSPSETGEETTGKRIVDCGANMAVIFSLHSHGSCQMIS